MESPSHSATPSLFLLSNELELNELLCDLSSPQSSNPFVSNTTLIPLQDQAAYHNDIDWDYSAPLTPSTLNRTNHGMASMIQLASAVEVAKRDWLSSLPVQSSMAVPVSSSPSNLHELICRSSSSTPSSQSTCADPLAHGKLRHSLSVHNLQSCGRNVIAGSSGEKASLGAAAAADNVGFVPSVSMQHVASMGCTNAGPKRSNIALRLSDIVAALRPKQPTISSSHTPDPTTLTSTASPTSLIIPVVSTPAPCNFSTSSQILADVDKILQESCKEAMPVVTSTRGGSKKNKKPSKAEKPGNDKELDGVGVLKCSVQNRKKRVQEPGPVTDPSTKREVHIFSERERRRGMTHLYGTLRSLLPEGKVKKVQPDRCSVLTETMNYIETLLEQLEDLGRQKTEALASVGGKAPMQASLVDAMHPEMGYADPKIDLSKHKSSKLAASVDWMNVTMKTAIAAALSSYYSSVEAISQDGHRSSMSEDHDDYDVDNHHDIVAAELENVEDNMDMFEDEGQCVGVTFFGEDIFITVRSTRQKGLWSGLLELLQKLGINVFNVTFAGSPDSDHHGIHAKVPSDCELNSIELQRCLKTFVNSMTKGSSPATFG